MLRTIDISVPRRVIPQPSVHLVAGGDCGACVLGGLVGRTVAEAYELAARGSGKGPKSLNYGDMVGALHDASGAGLIDRLVTDVPFFPSTVPDFVNTWGWPSRSQAGAWFDRLVMALEAGYYGAAMVDADRRGLAGGGTNHWVLLVGARLRWTPIEGHPGSSSGHREILVSCSSTKTPAEEWVEDAEFLSQRGGWNVILARPTEVG